MFPPCGQCFWKLSTFWTFTPIHKFLSALLQPLIWAFSVIAFCTHFWDSISVCGSLYLLDQCFLISSPQISSTIGQQHGVYPQGCAPNHTTLASSKLAMKGFLVSTNSSKEINNPHWLSCVIILIGKSHFAILILKIIILSLT